MIKLNALKSVLLAMALIMSMQGLTATAIADETTCKKVLHDCDLAVTDLQKENSLQKQIIADQGKVIGDQSSELHSEEFWKPVAEGALVVVILESVILALRK